ncbi:DUF4129 domain-containing protein [Thermosynechococcus sp. QKsg1]|uniref:DUF4129 domain-containing protein n=1 Tax=Thermosynechococcus sp. QKsg1 TaxID=3074130 RepID=UPI00287788D3|nr:DUF4129 domain-containing protein [Thermosynechococcus sp. QKsg1]WNC85799.1 DUF4129 domain-containing protein [Thermosynechococcus sp. QKsg1]
MSLFDDLRWQGDRQWRQLGEALEYSFRQLFRQQTEPFWQDSPSLEAWLRWFFQGVLLVGLGLALYFLGRSLWRWWQRRSRSSSATLVSTLEERPRPVREWLELAQDLQLAGDYGGACRALYMALLYRLQEAGWLRLQPHCTNGDYLRELERLFQLGERSPAVRRSIQHLFQVHSRSYYGAEAVDAQTLATCQAAYFEVAPFLRERQQ